MFRDCKTFHVPSNAEKIFTALIIWSCHNINEVEHTNRFSLPLPYEPSKMLCPFPQVLQYISHSPYFNLPLSIIVDNSLVNRISSSLFSPSYYDVTYCSIILITTKVRLLWLG